MKFKRGQDVKTAIGIGIREENGYNITDITDKNTILPGIEPDSIYIITHYGSKSVEGFCSGTNVKKIILRWMKKGFSNYQSKWLWMNWNEGGNLGFYYSSDGDFWTDANNTKGYSFQKMNKDAIMDL